MPNASDDLPDPDTFEAIAYSTIKLARHVPEEELSMDVLVAEAVLEFGNDLREACKAAVGG